MQLRVCLQGFTPRYKGIIIKDYSYNSCVKYKLETCPKYTCKPSYMTFSSNQMCLKVLLPNQYITNHQFFFKKKKGGGIRNRPQKHLTFQQSFQEIYTNGI
jgi:hypothetical protein